MEKVVASQKAHRPQAVESPFSYAARPFVPCFLYALWDGRRSPAFTVSGLINLHGVALETANTALTGHLFGVVGGILLAGFIADRFLKHMITAAGALILAAVASALPVLGAPPAIFLIAIMTMAGVGLGAVLPPRDLMLKALTPAGQTGKVFACICRILSGRQCIPVAARCLSRCRHAGAGVPRLCRVCGALIDCDLRGLRVVAEGELIFAGSQGFFRIPMQVIRS